MKFARFGFLLVAIALMVATDGFEVQAKSAKKCSAKKIAEILAPAREGKTTVKVYCSTKLPKKSRITKRIYFRSSKASNIEFNCNGAVLDGRAGQIGQGKDMIVIRSHKNKKGKLTRPSNVTVRNCKVLGSVKVIGMSPSGEGKVVKASSHSLGHTKRAQNAAPKNIKLLNMSITAQGRIPLYIAPGVTKLTLANSVIKGYTKSVAIYLDAESAYNTIRNNRFSVSTSKREIIAVDGSAHNLITRNIFSKLNNGGIYVYRNCGEGGTVRHQKPQYNKIIENGFFYRKFKGYKKSLRGFGKKKYVPAIWVGSRNGNRKYCSYDNGYNFGSSKNNGDFALNNTVANNQIVKLNPNKMIRSFSAGNKISNNRTVRKIKLRKKAKAPKPAPTPRQPNPKKPVAQQGQLSFSCKVKNNNGGCKKYVQCPAGFRVQAVRAACELEVGRVKTGQLNQVRWNALRVVRPSDRISQGVCSIGEIDISQGGADLSFLRDFERFYIGCGEYDKNGGDCEIRGQVICR